jgi:hypothetical protein
VIHPAVVGSPENLRCKRFLTTPSRLHRYDKSVKVADSESKSRYFWGQTRVLSTGSREAYPSVMYDFSATM